MMRIFGVVENRETSNVGQFALLWYFCHELAFDNLSKNNRTFGQARHVGHGIKSPTWSRHMRTNSEIPCPGTGTTRFQEDNSVNKRFTIGYSVELVFSNLQ
jgi:hypothetical protein